MTQTSKHTPGPWHANGIADNRIVGDENSACDKIHINGGNRTIARVYRSADATLIKSAPGLLAQLDRILGHDDALKPEFKMPSSLRREIESTVAKARGEDK